MKCRLNSTMVINVCTALVDRRPMSLERKSPQRRGRACLVDLESQVFCHIRPGNSVTTPHKGRSQSITPAIGNGGYTAMNETTELTGTAVHSTVPGNRGLKTAWHSSGGEIYPVVGRGDPEFLDGA